MAFANHGLAFLMIANYVEAAEHRRHSLRIRREIRNTVKPFDLPDRLFIQTFRFTKDITRKLIIDLEAFVEPSQRSSAIPFELKVLCALQFYANGSYQAVVGSNYTLGLSQPTVSRALTLISNLLCNHFLDEWVKFPQTQSERLAVQSKFYTKFGFRGVIGAIDCSHIQIIAPPALNPIYPGAVYIDRCSNYSINVEAVVDANLNILAINSRYPGSMHDSAIWQMSAIHQHLKDKFAEGERSSWLIGDSGYPLQPWLFTPVARSPEDSPEGLYNKMHASARNCVERAFGVMKMRFRCIFRHRVLHYSPPMAAKIIYSCAILHNIATYHRLPEPELPDEETEVPVPPEPQHQNQTFLRLGQTARASFIQENFR